MAKLYELQSQARLLAPPLMPKLQKAVLTCLISYSNKNGDGTQIFVGIKRIALECSCSERQAQRCLRWLEAAGWIIPIYQKGGYKKPSGYHLSLDQFGWLEARPPAPVEPEAVEPVRRLNFARGILRRLKPDSPARPRWQEEVDELEAILCLVHVDPAAGSEPPNLPALVVDYDLIPLKEGVIDQTLREALYYWLDMLIRQRDSPANSHAWWQRRIDQAREKLNRELIAQRIIAVDQRAGEAPIDGEIELQIQAMYEIWELLKENVERFHGLPDFMRVQAFADEMLIAVNDLMMTWEQKTEILQEGYVT